MYNYHFLNGEYVSLDDAQLSVGDLGIVRGYAIFDYFQVVDQVPLHMDEHIRRFMNSAESLRLNLNFSLNQFKDCIYQLIKINDIQNAGMKLLATGGFSSDGFDLGSTSLAIICQPYKEMPDHLKQNGGKLLSHEYVRDMPKIKTTNYIMAVYLNEKITSHQAIEPLYYTKASVSECSRSNIFGVFNEKLVTPRDNILEGITRNQIITLAKNAGLEVETRDMPLGELLRADEVFITGTIKRVLPIRQIDDHLIGDGQPGPVTRMLQSKHLNLEEAIILSQKSLV